jgi:hypothetical protein
LGYEGRSAERKVSLTCLDLKSTFLPTELCRCLCTLADAKQLSIRQSDQMVMNLGTNSFFGPGDSVGLSFSLLVDIRSFIRYSVSRADDSRILMRDWLVEVKNRRT